jgi:hypothetical protein
MRGYEHTPSILRAYFQSIHLTSVSKISETCAEVRQLIRRENGRVRLNDEVTLKGIIGNQMFSLTIFRLDSMSS